MKGIFKDYNTINRMVIDYSSFNIALLLISAGLMLGKNLIKTLYLYSINNYNSNWLFFDCGMMIIFLSTFKLTEELIDKFTCKQPTGIFTINVLLKLIVLMSYFYLYYKLYSLVFWIASYFILLILSNLKQCERFCK